MRNGLLAILVMGLAACGGGGGNAFIGDGSGGSTGGGVDTETLEFFLAGADSSASGVIDIQKDIVEGNGSTALGVRLLDQNGNAYTATSPDVRFFTTECSGTSIFSDLSGASGSSFTPNAAGVVRVNWTDQGCNTGSTTKAVTLRAAVDDSGTQRNATGNLTLNPVSVGSVLNNSPLSPVVIALDNQGSSERLDSQEVSFKVVSSGGDPVQGRAVCFELAVAPFGATLTAATDVSDATGIVKTIVQAGSVSGSVVVRASDLNGRDNCGVAEPSNTDFATNRQVVISSGLAVQDRFSISSANFNIEGYDQDGATTSIRIDAADVFSNPIRNGESVIFQSSGASISSPCEPVDGTCAVTFKSQNSRPDNGRVVIMARIKGEEGFLDTNGNGRFDDSEFATVNEKGEAYIDADESNSYDSGVELFIDEEPLNGVRDNGDGEYNGSTCQPGGFCSTKQSLNVWESLVVVLSRTSSPDVTEILINPDPIDIPQDGSATVTILVAGIMPDNTRQPMPSGTTVVAESDVGEFVGDSSFVVPSTNAPGYTVFTTRVKDSGDPASGTFTVTVQSEGGVEVTASVAISQP